MGSVDSGPTVFVYGSGGHARVVADCVRKSMPGCRVVFADDDRARWGEAFAGSRVIGGVDALLSARQTNGASGGVVAIGQSQVRTSIANRLRGLGFSLITVVHPSAQIGDEVSLGSGAAVLAGAVVNAHTTVGRDVILNTKASVDHDCTIGEGVHVSQGATLCGHVTVGPMAYLGPGATVVVGVTVGAGATVLAGSVVTCSVPDGSTVGWSSAQPLTDTA